MKFLRGIQAFLWGAREFRSDVTMNFDADGTEEGCDLQDAYETGREWAHRLTLRRWDHNRDLPGIRRRFDRDTQTWIDR